ncbi:MAG: hypothetical protein WAL75_21905 [Terracidiphilus sp.]
MSDRKKSRGVLEGEAALWSKKTPDQIIAELPETKAYQIRVESVEYNVEVELLENTESYIHFAIGVEDGRLPSAIFPVSDSFILKKCDTP